MNYLLKIVEGPNKGAEIALVDGVAVTLGKGDECDIVLADPTMPDEPLTLQVSSDGVTVGGEPLEPLAVKAFGATSFAVGPADAPWGELKWPKADEPEKQETPQPAADPEAPERPEPSENPETPVDSKKKHGGCCGCLVALVVLLLLIAGLAWFLRDKLNETGCFDGIRDSRWVEKVVAVSKDGYARTSELVARWRTQDPQPTDVKPPRTLKDVADVYGLSLSETGGVSRVSGNFRTRRERLAATAEAYALRAGVELDFSDDESLRSSAEDALFTLTEGAMKVSAATNRTLAIVGRSPSAAALKKALESLNADMPRLRWVDVSGVVIGGAASASVCETADDGQDVGGLKPRVSRRSSKKSSTLSLPVCGIMTTPYPCLITRDGRRYLEGAAFGNGVILKIGADSVVITNSTGRFTWKP